MQHHARVLELNAQNGMLGHIRDHFAHAREEPPIVQRGVACRNPVPVEVARLTAQPGRLASARTGTGPSEAAIPPTVSRVIKVVLAPSRAACSAAKTPAGPAPMTPTPARSDVVMSSP